MPARDTPTPGDAVSSSRIGARLRAAREERGLTLRAVADASAGGFQVAALSAWERGERRIGLASLMWLADHYGVAVGDVLGRHDDDGHHPVLVVDRDRLADAAPYWAPLRALVDRTVAAREEDPGPTIRLRADDVEFLAAVLDLTVPDLMERLGATDLLG